MSVQAVAFDKSIWSRASSADWIAKNARHLGGPIKPVHETANMYHYRLIEPSTFSNFRTIKPSPGIVMTIGYNGMAGSGLFDKIKAILSKIKGVVTGPTAQLIARGILETVAGLPASYIHARSAIEPAREYTYQRRYLAPRQPRAAPRQPRAQAPRAPRQRQRPGVSSESLDRLGEILSGNAVDRRAIKSIDLKGLGELQVSYVRICREPYERNLCRAIEDYAAGIYDESFLPHDAVFTLSIIVNLVSPDGTTKLVRLFKGDDGISLVNFNGELDEDAKCVNLPATGTLLEATRQYVGPAGEVGRLNLEQMLSNGEQYQDSKAPGTFTGKYDERYNNNQVFAAAIMRGNKRFGLYTKEADDFVMESMDKILSLASGKVATLLTEGAARGDVRGDVMGANLYADSMQRGFPGFQTGGNRLGAGDDNVESRAHGDDIAQARLASEVINNTTLAPPLDPIVFNEGSRYGFEQEREPTIITNDYRPQRTVEADIAAQLIRDRDYMTKVDALHTHGRGTMIGEMLVPASLGGIGHPFPSSASIFTPTLSSYYQSHHQARTLHNF
jgi:hypothetical protein